MIEIRIHGRGGQGAVTCAQIIAIAAFYDNKYSQAFPIFGIERSGSPVAAYVRIDNKKINLRSQIYNPDYVIVLDPSLMNVVNVKEGLKKELIINTSKKIKDAYCVDASKIAIDVIGNPFVNVIMAGVFAQVTKVISTESILKAIEEKFKEKLDVIELNKKSINKVCEIKGVC
ncbi:MAG: 2-oxoacid:acceptor oxidoreductase family protein [Candidatus Woesearchaeota archaeon]